MDQVAKLTLHQGSVYALCGGDQSDFFSGGSEGIVARWNLNSLQDATAVAKVNGQVFSLLHLPKLARLVIGTMSGGLHVIDLVQKKEIHNITYHEQSIFDIREHDGRVLVASKDGSLTVWNSASFQLERVLTISDQSLRVIDINDKGKVAAIGSSDNCVYLLNLETMQVTGKLEGATNSVFSVCFLDEERLLAGSRDARLYLFNLHSMKAEQEIKAHLYTVNSIRRIPEANLVATASRDRVIRIWNAGNLELLRSLNAEKYNGHVNSVNKLLWLPAENLLVSASDDRSVIIWKITF